MYLLGGHRPPAEFPSALDTWNIVEARLLMVYPVHQARDKLMSRMIAFGALACEDPRDKVCAYFLICDPSISDFIGISKITNPPAVVALLSIASDQNKLAIVPDYTLSELEASAHMAKRIIEVYRNLDLFSMTCFGLGPDPSEGSYPSWAPNWSRNIAQTYINFQGDAGAASDIEPTFTFNVGHEFVIRGIVVDTITSREVQFRCQLDLLQFPADYSTAKAEYQAIESARAKLHQSQDHQSRLQIDTALCHTVLATSFGAQPWEEAAAAFGEMMTILKRVHDEAGGVAVSPERPSISQDDEMMELFAERSHIISRSLCTTEKNRPMLAPWASEPGDIVVLLFGGALLYTLRPKGEQFQYVGDGFIHGLVCSSCSTSVMINSSITDILNR